VRLLAFPPEAEGEQTKKCHNIHSLQYQYMYVSLSLWCHCHQDIIVCAVSLYVSCFCSLSLHGEGRVESHIAWQ